MKSISKMLATVMLALGTTVVMADTAVMVTQPAGRGNSNDLWVEMITSSMDARKIKYQYEVGTCATSIQAWDKAGDRDPAVILYSSLWARRALVEQNGCIPRDWERMKIYAVIHQPWLVCRNRNTSKPMDARGVVFSHHTTVPGVDMAKDINESNGFDWKPVSNKGSGESFLQLMNGDVDYATIAKSYAEQKITKDSPVVCDLSWKRGDTMPYFLDRVKMKNDPSGIMYYSQMILGKNLTPKLESDLKDIHNRKNPLFVKWVDGLGGDLSYPANHGEYLKNFVRGVQKDMETFRR